MNYGSSLLCLISARGTWAECGCGNGEKGCFPQGEARKEAVVKARELERWPGGEERWLSPTWMGPGSVEGAERCEELA